MSWREVLQLSHARSLRLGEMTGNLTSCCQDLAYRLFVWVAFLVATGFTIAFTPDLTHVSCCGRACAILGSVVGILLSRRPLLLTSHWAVAGAVVGFVLGLQLERIVGTSASPFMGAPYSLIVAVLFLSIARISVEASLLWCAIVSISCCASRRYAARHDGKRRRVLCGLRAAVSLLVLVVIELRSM
jgi:hypothetical protein